MSLRHQHKNTRLNVGNVSGCVSVVGIVLKILAVFKNVLYCLQRVITLLLAGAAENMTSSAHLQPHISNEVFHYQLVGSYILQVTVKQKHKRCHHNSSTCNNHNWSEIVRHTHLHPADEVLIS